VRTQSPRYCPIRLVAIGGASALSTVPQGPKRDVLHTHSPDGPPAGPCRGDLTAVGTVTDAVGIRRATAAADPMAGKGYLRHSLERLGRWILEPGQPARKPAAGFLHGNSQPYVTLRYEQA